VNIRPISFAPGVARNISQLASPVPDSPAIPHAHLKNPISHDYHTPNGVLMESQPAPGQLTVGAGETVVAAGGTD
jgi:hypothetical protein